MLKLGSGIIALILASAFGVFVVQDAMAQSSKLVWFAPESHYPPAKDSDFLEIFRQPEAWNETAKHVQVFQLSTQFFLGAPQAVVNETVTFLKQRHIALAVSVEAACGQIPGTADFARTIVGKVQKAGSIIDYVTLDEPFWNVHVASLAKLPSACQLSTKDAAQHVAEIVGVYTAAFPNIMIGDVEPFPILKDDPGWKADYVSWLHLFAQATGRQIAFLHLDFNWREPRLTKGSVDVSNPDAIISLAREVAAFARQQGLKVGMIFDGKSNAATDSEWVQEARANVNFINKSGINADHLAFESWHKHPEKILPESDESSFSGLILKAIGKAP